MGGLLGAGASAHAKPVELLRCVQELKEIRKDSNDRFETQAEMALGYLNDRLFVVNERGVFSFAMQSGRENRIQFDLPDPDPRRLAQRLFVQVRSSQIYGIKLVSLDLNSPPHGQAPSDYRFVDRNAREPEEHQFLQLVKAELAELIFLAQTGKVSRLELMSGNLSLCREVGDPGTGLQISLAQQVSELEILSQSRALISQRGKGLPNQGVPRAPASLGAK